MCDSLVLRKNSSLFVEPQNVARARAVSLHEVDTGASSNDKQAGITRATKLFLGFCRVTFSYSLYLQRQERQNRFLKLI